MGAVAGASARVSLAFVLPMALYIWPKYIGTKPPARKIYVALRDAAAEKHGLLRIIDESGEDYLHPNAFFRSIALPLAVKRAVLAAA
jgi:hypothetical protein